MLPGILKFRGDHKFLVGDSPTWVDFFFFELTDLMKFIQPELFEVYPSLQSHWTNVRNLPKLKEYLDNPDTIDHHRQFNNSMAQINNNVHYTLYYLPIYGRGECLKMMLSHAGVNFTNTVIPF